PEDHLGLRYLIAVLAVERDGDIDRVRRVAADVGRNEVTISRAIRRFADAANVYYSLDWLSFVYAMYTKLRETSREMVAV
ncbi:MAG TPA: hypothetical protein VGP12_03695, partial [Nitrosospira sp.]|nr:hypothetical protein [Nitrosospira sp.]